MSNTDWAHGNTRIKIERVAWRLWAWEVQTETNSMGGFTTTRWAARRRVRGYKITGLQRKTPGS